MDAATPLNLHLKVEGQLINFYRLDTGEKLLVPGELAQTLKQEALAQQQAEQRAEQAEARLAELEARLRARGIELNGEE